jgi:thiosulfate/3-mercaptopyruvate sulfurtransferase
LLTVQRFGPVVDVEWLAANLGEPGVVVVDCRYTLTDPKAGERGWLEGHIPGAAFLSVSRDLAGELRDGGRDGGRAPLPPAPDFEASARRAGIGEGSKVVAYDEAGEGGATRLWWLLRHFGHDEVAVLNGGLAGWRAEGGPLAEGAEDIPARSFSVAAGRAQPIELEEIGGGQGPLLLDARVGERYRGESEPIDAVAGHIPGARNLPASELAPGGRFLPADELRARFEAAGASSAAEVGAYCGSGVAACVTVLASELAGIGTARLYPGSWSEWSRRGMPVARQQ